MFQIKCRKCGCCFDNRKHLFTHQKIHHYQFGSGDLQQIPFNDDDAPWKMEDGTTDLEMKAEYHLNRDIILHKSEEGELINLSIC